MTTRLWSALACAAIATGCAGSSSADPGPATAATAPGPAAPTGTSVVASTSTTRAERIDYGAKYLALIQPVNDALDALNATDPNKDVPAAIIAFTVQAISDFDAAALRINWPGPGTNEDIKALVRADAAVIADLRVANDQTAATVRAFGAKYAQDDQASATASNIVRRDLGLPPPPLVP